MRLIRRILKQFSQENIDRIISGGIWPQVGLLLSVICIVLLSAFGIALLLNLDLRDSQGLQERLWAVYNNFIDSGNLVEEQAPGNRLFAIAISIIGSVLMGGVLISTISNIIERRVDKITNGEVTYKDIQNHFVIIGYGEITVCLINKLFSQIGQETVPLILLTWQDVELVRNSLHSQISDDKEGNVKIYLGNMDSDDALRRLNINKARAVYILGEQADVGRDSKNIECLKKICSHRGSNAESLLPVYVQFDRTPSYSNIQKLILSDEYLKQDGKSVLIFHPFNFHENWARRLWSFYSMNDNHYNYEPLDYRPISIRQVAGKNLVDNRDFVHLVIVGFNRMGRALLLEALRICHFANYDDRLADEQRIRTRITVVDKDMDSQLESFKTQYPYIEKQIDDIVVEYLNLNICGTELRSKLVSWSQDENRMLTITVCLKDPDISLSTGLNFPPEIYENKVRVLIRQELREGLGNLLINPDKQGVVGRYAFVKIFGMLSEGLEHEMLSDDLPMFINEGYNDSEFVRSLYEAHIESRNEEERCLRKIAENSWNILPEMQRWSNRYQVDAYRIYLRTLGLDIDKSSGNVVLYKISLDSEQLYFLMSMEHYRWNAERSIKGWRSGKKRDNIHLIHPDIIPFNLLQSKDQQKDKVVIDRLPYLMVIGGYQITKIH